ncbi:unnamed protein product [Fraxinus pennsylvanica]|uniref:Uncharacterized protein n=1 Tax=Fraxinus pennsylvanica TaxID=56036 RepID=A0AAD1ZFV5_9LAMI|nr:unnamed protein product [Fraxinus pennsylvanica]
MAIDLPGSGFSDKSMAVIEENVGVNVVFGNMWNVYGDIKKKGLFWRFDQLIEQGYVSHEEIENHVDLVLHDSALGLSANWISENQGSVRSVVFLDAAPSGMALPLWALEMPGV